jgi:hypothetical protein
VDPKLIAIVERLVAFPFFCACRLACAIFIGVHVFAAA